MFNGFDGLFDDGGSFNFSCGGKGIRDGGGDGCGNGCGSSISGYRCGITSMSNGVTGISVRKAIRGHDCGLGSGEEDSENNLKEIIEKNESKYMDAIVIFIFRVECTSSLYE